MRKPSQERALDIVRHQWERAEHRQPASPGALFVKDAVAVVLAILGVACFCAGIVGQKEHRDHGAAAGAHVVPAQGAEDQAGAGVIGHGAHDAGAPGGGA